MNVLIDEILRSGSEIIDAVSKISEILDNMSYTEIITISSLIITVALKDIYESCLSRESREVCGMVVDMVFNDMIELFHYVVSTQ